MKTTKQLFGLIAFLVFSAAFSQDGTLDPTFDGDGITLPNYGSLESENLYLKVLPDGKIVTVETVSAHGADSQYYLRRYNSSGFHDSGFGVGGTVTSNFPGLTARVNGIELQSDGKILIGGVLSGTGGGVFIARYNSNGVLDSTFGVSGLTIISADLLESFALLPDGKILVGYHIFQPSAPSLKKIARYNSNGILDASFGIGGTINILEQGKIEVQNDGKFLVATGSSDFVFKRYLNNGTIDTTFGTAGTAIINIDASDFLESVKVQSDGKIVFVGNSSSGYHLVRLLSNGTLDASFGTAGLASLSMTSSQVDFQPDGKIIVAGSLPMDSPNQLALSRYLTNGTLDVSFGTSGFAYASMGASVRVIPNALEVSTDGKILVGGYFCEAFLSCHPHSFVTRFNITSLSTPDFDISKNNFVVYPNPVDQIVNIEFNLNQSEVLSIDLFDLNGRKISNLVNKENFQSGSNSQKMELPESLTHGVYFLNISDGKNTSTIKIVK